MGKKKNQKALSKAEIKKKVEEIKAAADSPLSSSSPAKMEIAQGSPVQQDNSTRDIVTVSDTITTSSTTEALPRTRVELRPHSTKIPTVSWAQVSSGDIPTAPSDNRLVRPLFFLSNLTLDKLSQLARDEIPDFNEFGLDIVGNQSQNIEGKITTFQGEFSDELEDALTVSNGHYLALSPIYGGGKGQRTESEVISIIEQALAHPNFCSMVVVTSGNRGADYLSFDEYTQYNSVLNYSQLTAAIQKSKYYRTMLVAKETETLLSKEGASSFPLVFHILYKQEVPNCGGYIISARSRVPLYRRLDCSEELSQLTPGIDRFTVIGGTWKTINAYGQSLIKAGVTVVKTRNSSGDAQLVVENKSMTIRNDEALDLGMWITKVSDMKLKDGETILAVQKKGSTVPMMVKHPSIKKYARFIQPSGGCRISMVVASNSVQEFVREANTAGMLVFSISGRIFNVRNNQSDTGYSVLPDSVGDIEIPSIPICITKPDVTSVLQEVTKDIDWIATRGSSPFNYSLVGVFNSSKVTPEIIEKLRKSIERFGLIVLKY